MLIKYTKEDGSTVAIDTNFVAAVEPVTKNSARIICAGGNSVFLVKGAFESIVNDIEEGNL